MIVGQFLGALLDPFVWGPAALIGALVSQRGIRALLVIMCAAILTSLILQNLENAAVILPSDKMEYALASVFARSLIGILAAEVAAQIYKGITTPP